MHIVNIMWTVRGQGVIMGIRVQIVMMCVIVVWCFDDYVVSGTCNQGWDKATSKELIMIKGVNMGLNNEPITLI